MKFITNEQLFGEVILPLSKAGKFVWIGTADIKDMHISYRGQVTPFLSLLNDLCKKRVEIRLLHAKEPGPNFRRSFDRYPLLIERMERQLCPRVHFKHIIVDGSFAYTGSANLTGAGLGIKGVNTRNFEAGVVSGDPEFVKEIMQQFDNVWMGKHCTSCRRREYCGDPIR